MTLLKDASPSIARYSLLSTPLSSRARMACSACFTTCVRCVTSAQPRGNVPPNLQNHRLQVVVAVRANAQVQLLRGCARLERLGHALDKCEPRTTTA